MNSVYTEILQRYYVNVTIKVNAPDAEKAKLIVTQVIKAGDSIEIISGVPKAERNLCTDIKQSICKGDPKFKVE